MMRSPAGRRPWLSLLRSALSVALLIGLWALLARLVSSAIILPGPEEVLVSLGRLLGDRAFPPVVLSTLLRVFVALLISVPLASAVGVLAGLRPAFDDFLRPLFALITATPVLSIILIAFFVFGQEGTPLFTAFLMVFPIVTQASMGAVRDIDQALVQLCRVYRLPLSARLRWLWLPALLPRVAQALRAGLGMSWKVVVAAEVLVQPFLSLGKDMYLAKMNLETADLFALTLVTVALAAASEALIPLSARILRNSARRGLWRQRAGLADAAVVPPSLPDFGSLAAAEKGAAREPVAPDAGGRLVFERVSFSWPGHQVLEDFSFAMESGERVAILGPSACGKTTILSLAAGLCQIQSGGIRAPSAAMVFQDSRLFPKESILDNVALPFQGPVPFGVDAASWRARGRAAAREMLERVGLGTRSGALPAALSGGQRQRAALARAFVADAPLLLMDEPFQSLDLPLRIQLMDVSLELLASFPRSVLLVTHDPREAIYLADRILVMGRRGGRIVAEERVSLSREERAFSSTAAAEMEARLFAALERA